MATSRYEEGDVSFPDTECRIVLAGKTGNGKSSTGNTILGRPNHFKVGFSLVSETKRCQRGHARRFGVDVEVVDCPGFFDTEVDNEKTRIENLKAFAIVSPGPHAFLITFSLNARFTEEENKTMELLTRNSSKVFLKYLIIAFTGGDNFQAKDEKEMYAKLSQFLKNVPTAMKNLLRDIDNRYVVFNNKADSASKGEQVKIFLETVKQLYLTNNQEVFKHEYSEQLEREMQKREDELRKKEREIQKQKEDLQKQTEKEAKRREQLQKREEEQMRRQEEQLQKREKKLQEEEEEMKLKARNAVREEVENEDGVILSAIKGMASKAATWIWKKVTSFF